jgi:hypothetical protein
MKLGRFAEKEKNSQMYLDYLSKNRKSKSNDLLVFGANRPLKKFIQFIFIIKLNNKGKNTVFFAVILFGSTPLSPPPLPLRVFRRACICYTESRKTEREKGMSQNGR